MANTHSARGGTVDHSKVAATNETMLLVASLESLSWTYKKLDAHFGVSAGTTYQWSRGSIPASEAQRKELRKLAIQTKKELKRKGEYDHSPKTPEEQAAQDAERAEAMIKAHGTTEPVKALGIANKRARTKPQPAADDKRVITVLVKDNPKRPGSKSHARFALYKTGMTVGEFLAAGGTSGDVAWDARHKFIEVK